MGQPKRHHYVPEVILKRFTDDNGWLHLHSEHDRRTRPSRPVNAFLEGHLYSEELDSGDKDPRVEGELAELDGLIDPILQKFEMAAESGENPGLSAFELLTWQFFMVVQWQRVPDLHRTVATDEESAALLHDVLDEASRKFPERLKEIEAMRAPHAVTRTVRNARIRNIPEVSQRVMDAMATRGIAVLSIRGSKKALIIGSRPVVQMAFRDGLTLIDEATEMWLPISSKVAVGAGQRGLAEIVYSLDDHAAIRRLNLAVARQSSEIASRSTVLTNSIAKAVYP